MKNEVLDQEKKEYTEGFLTRQGKKILFLIQRNPGICSGELAVKLNIKKNSMSNALERLRGSRYELVYSKTEGRQKRYYLTEWGENYTRTSLNTLEMIRECLNEGEGDVSEGLKQDLESSQKKALECIADLKRISSEWEIEFFEYLCDEDEYSDTEIKLLLSEFMRLLQEVYSAGNEVEFQDTLGKISSEKVKKKVLICLDRKCGLIPLWNWAEDAGEEVYQFIDELFDERRLVLSYEFIQAYERYELSEASYRQISLCLMRLIASARREKLNKMEFYKRILEQNPQCDWQLGYYIAEKFRELEKEMEK